MDRDAFIREVAALRREGEPDAEGNETEWENDDCWETLHALIGAARALLGLPDRIQ